MLDRSTFFPFVDLAQLALDAGDDERCEYWVVPATCRRLHDRLGSWPRALAAYHAEPRRVEEGRVPAETLRYVARVLRTWQPRRLAWMNPE